jgi:hypothetical protein
VASSADHRGHGERQRQPAAGGRAPRFDSATDEDDDLVEVDRAEGNGSKMRQHGAPKHKLTNREITNILGREDLKAKSQARSKLANQ